MGGLRTSLSSYTERGYDQRLSEGCRSIPRDPLRLGGLRLPDHNPLTLLLLLLRTLLPLLLLLYGLLLRYRLLKLLKLLLMNLERKLKFKQK